MAEIVRQQPAAGGVRGTGILPQQVDAARAKASCALRQKIARLSEYTLMRTTRSGPAFARSSRYQFTAVVFP